MDLRASHAGTPRSNAYPERRGAHLDATNGLGNYTKALDDIRICGVCVRMASLKKIDTTLANQVEGVLHWRRLKHYRHATLAESLRALERSRSEAAEHKSFGLARRIDYLQACMSQKAETWEG